MRPERIIVAAVLAIGLWQLAAGAWLPLKAWAAQSLLREAWEETRAGTEAVRPWPWADTWPVARLRAIGGMVDLVVLSGGSGRTLAFGPGHLQASAAPGAPGNTVLVGHRDTHFRFLAELEAGDELELETGDGRWLHYRVTGTAVLDARSDGIGLDDAADRLTLVTCYPFDAARSGGPLRYLVTAERPAGGRAIPAAARPR
ncbi:MAG: class GN sortase [Gammaproteobacteria bacterium]|jgi:sortase A|nr:class GN sortase [Gammaproteobacteria bacterium]